MAALRPDREDYSMRQKIGNRGLVKGLLVLCVLVAIVFVGVSFGKPYYRYYTLSSHTRDFLKSDTFNPVAIRANIINLGRFHKTWYSDTAVTGLDDI